MFILTQMTIKGQLISSYSSLCGHAVTFKICSKVYDFMNLFWCL